MKYGQPAKSMTKLSINAAKVMLCIWFNQKGVVDCELLKPGKTTSREIENANAETISQRTCEYTRGKYLPL